jgi:hypothetical protein
LMNCTSMLGFLVPSGAAGSSRDSRAQGRYRLPPASIRTGPDASNPRTPSNGSAASHDARQPAVRQSEAEIGADVAIESGLDRYGTESWQLGMHERIADVVKRDRRLVSGKLVHYCLELGPRHAPRKRLLSQNSGLVDGRPRVHAIGTAKIAHRGNVGRSTWKRDETAEPRSPVCRSVDSATLLALQR